VADDGHGRFRGVVDRLEGHHQYVVIVVAADWRRRGQRSARRSRRTASANQDPTQLRQSRTSGVQLFSPRHCQVRTDARANY